MLDTPSPILTWTPELVEERLVEAFETLRAIGGRVGPKMFGNAMPAVIRELWDLQAAERDERPPRRLPSKLELSRMEEALAWPAMLFDPYREADDAEGRDRDTRVADAVGLWAACIANRQSISAILRARSEAGEVLKVASQRALDWSRSEGASQIGIKLSRIGVAVRPGYSERYRAMKSRAERRSRERRSPKSWHASPSEAEPEQENCA